MDRKQSSEQRYVDILTNGGFKAFFGDENNKSEVMTIINTLLPEHRQVVEIEYLPTEYQGPIIGHSKEFHYDFMCKDVSGAVFIVEMQRYREKAWFKRCVSYASRAYDRQNKAGEDYDVPPVYLIGLMGIEIDHPDKEFWKERYVSEYTFREKESHDLLGETIVIIFAELEKFRKSEDECHSRLDRMLYILKNSGRLHIPPKWSSSDNYTDILDACEIEAFDEDKRIKYDSDMYDEKRLKGVTAAAREDGFAEGMEKGIEKGIAEGMEKGMEQGKMAVAQNLLKMGMTVEDVATATGLPVESLMNL